jgi:microcystin-dependent protein
MSEAILGEIRMFSGNFAPRGWMFCSGQQLQVGQYQALYAIVGNLYGGTAGSTFNLPDLRGRLPVHAQPGSPINGVIPNVQLAQGGGSTQSSPIAVPLPPHTHNATFTGTGGGGGGGGNPNGTLGVDVQIAVANTNTSNTTNPQSNILAVPKFSAIGSINAYTAPANATPNAYLGGVTANLTGQVAPGGGGITGGSVTIAAAGTGSVTTASVTPPYLGINFIICVEGLFPSRN